MPTAEAACAFDIDNTITCGKEHAKELIGWCREQGFGLGIITARPQPVPPNDWAELGFTLEEMQRHLHHNPDSYSQTGPQNGEQKARSMAQLQADHGVADKSCVLLVDDMDYNITAAQRHGFSAVRVGGDGRCGLTRETVREAQAKLAACVGAKAKKTAPEE